MPDARRTSAKSLIISTPNTLKLLYMLLALALVLMFWYIITYFVVEYFVGFPNMITKLCITAVLNNLLYGYLETEAKI